MKKPFLFIVNVIASGLLIVVPIYLAVLLILKAMTSAAGVVRPLSHVFPAWVPAERLLSLLFVLTICLLIGLAVRTRAGHAARNHLEKNFFERIPGYATIRSLTRRMAGDENERVWKPAFVEIEEALVPAFIIEEFDDGRFTVFVPSIPTPFAGSVYILDRNRVHPVEATLPQMLRIISRWGSSAKDIVSSAVRVGSITD